MHIKRNKRLSIFSLLSGYLFLFIFVLLIILQDSPEDIVTSAPLPSPSEPPAIALEENKAPPSLFISSGPVIEHTISSSILSPEIDEAFSTDSVFVDRTPLNVLGDGVRDIIHHGHNRDIINHRGDLRAVDETLTLDSDIDIGILDRRLSGDDGILVYSDEDDLLGIDGRDEALRDRDNIGLDLGGNDDIDATRFELDEDGQLGDNDLGDIGDFSENSKGAGKGDLPGIGEGSQVYAYNFPSQGVGAGIGSPGVGAAAGFAGIGAGIGQAVLNGAAVAALGGIGTESRLSTDPTNPDGVAGLSNGAGAGAAAGLINGSVQPKLGLGIEPAPGAPYGGSRGGQINLDDLPPNGSLHIMMHVDGSGSILSTRKQLDLMKNTLLKEALLPYYNDDESLYNKRVTIIDGSGERTLRFFREAASKPNVLAVAFQDEASPDYHLPTFNKKPQHHYLADLSALKSSLNGHGGLYRGIIFQVDRGKTFAKSFKEMVYAAWNGEGYLKEENLKSFHRDNNLHRIKNKNGIVFSDEYHAKSDGDPEYYMDLLFKASKRVGINLNIYGAGLSDGLNNSLNTKK